MKLTKKIIVSNIAEATNLTARESSNVFDFFIDTIKDNSATKTVKINNFGSFFYKYTPKRIGRNPKTGDQYAIKPFFRLVFRPSFRLKNFLN